MSNAVSSLQNSFDYTGLEAELAEAFPAIDPGIAPAGALVLVQLRAPKRKTKSGLIMSIETKEIDKWNQQIGKVIAMGPLAFKNRDTLQPWAEGPWCQVGDFIRVIKWGGDRWEVPVPGSEEPAMFVITKDLDVIGKVTGNVLDITARNLNI